MSASGQTIESFNPSTGDVLAVLPSGNQKDVDNAVRAARETFESTAWQDMVPAERGRVMNRIAHLIRENKEELARMESLEIGKPLSQARVDAEVAARYFEYFGGVADKILGSVIPVTSGVLNFTVREPWGVSAQIIPWNYPMQIGCRGIAPALAAGNTVVAKPSEEGALTLLRVGEIVLEAGLAPGALNIITGLGEEAGRALAMHPDINHCTFTGSVEVGTEVMRAAALNIVPVNLELGGKSPNILFADADMEGALPVVARSLIQNAGQTCSAGSRLLVEESAHRQVVEAMAERFGSVRVGQAVDDPDMGPLVSGVQRDRVEGYIRSGVRDGLRVAAGGGRPSDPNLPRGGFYIQPTILDDADIALEVTQQEIFGPVLTVTPFRDVEEAARMANATPYGLVAAVWTHDINKAHWLATKIRAGQVYINTFGAGGGVELPFGGYRKSGFGREKGLESLTGYTQVKNVCIKYA